MDEPKFVRASFRPLEVWLKVRCLITFGFDRHNNSYVDYSPWLFSFMVAIPRSFRPTVFTQKSLKK